MEMTINEYLVFSGQQYYPLGGWLDYSSSFNSIQECIEFIKLLDPCYAWAHVIHKNNMKIILYAVAASEEYDETQWKFDQG